MAEKLKIDDKEYVIADLSEDCQKVLSQIKTVDLLIADRKNLLSVLTRAKNSYVSSIRNKVLSDTAGFDFLE